MVTMQANPLNSATLARERAANQKEVLKPLRNAKAAVGNQAMPAQRNPQASSDPVE